MASRNKVCPRLVNGHDCTDDSCRQTASHNAANVTWWIRNKKSKVPCHHPWPCWPYEDDLCLFRHEPGAPKLVDLRLQSILDGLTLPPASTGVWSTSDDTALPSAAEHADPVSPAARISDCKLLASFNRISDKDIAVPGRPPTFTPLSAPLETPKDTAPQAKPYPQYRHPLSPELAAIQAANASHALASAQLMCNAGALRRLYWYLNEAAPPAPSSSHIDRFELQYKGGTLFVSRWGADPKSVERMGFALAFERATCAMPAGGVLGDSVSYHHVVGYDFAGIGMVVCFEVSAFVDDEGDADEVEKAAEEIHNLDLNAVEGDQIIHGLAIRKAVHRVPPSGIVHTMVRSTAPPSSRPIEPTLYFSRVRKLYRDLRNAYVFTPNTHIEDVSATVDEWEPDNQEGLGRLAAFLRWVLEAVAGMAEEEEEEEGGEGGAPLASLVVRREDERTVARIYVNSAGGELVPPEFACGKSDAEQSGM